MNKKLNQLFDAAPNSSSEGAKASIPLKGISGGKQAWRCGEDFLTIQGIANKDTKEVYRVLDAGFDELEKLDLASEVHTYAIIPAVTDLGQQCFFHLKAVNNTALRSRKEAIEKAMQEWVRFERSGTYDILAVPATDIVQDPELPEWDDDEDLMDQLFAERTLSGPDCTVLADVADSYQKKTLQNLG